MVNYREKIKYKQVWGDKMLYFEPDSSPAAWKHFNNFYTDEHWGKDGLKEYCIEDPCFFNNIKSDNYFQFILNGINYGGKNREGKWHNYVDYPKESINTSNTFIIAYLPYMIKMQKS